LAFPQKSRESKQKNFYINHLLQYYKDGKAEDELLLLTVTGRMNLISEDIICSGLVDSSPVVMRKMFEIIFSNNAVGVIVARFYKNETNYSIDENIEIARKMMWLCAEMRIKFIEYYIICDNEILSIRDKII